MKKKKFLILGGILILILSAFLIIKARRTEDVWICQDGVWIKHGNPKGPSPTGACIEGEMITPSVQSEELSLPNPASKYCTDKGGKLEFLEETAGMLGICKFSDGSECEEWKFYRGECSQGQTTQADTSHPYVGTITKENDKYIFQTKDQIKFNLELPSGATSTLLERLKREINQGETTIIAVETPPLSRNLLLLGFQEK